MSSLLLALVAAMLTHWTAALSVSHDQQDNPEMRDYFEGVSEIMLRARGKPSNETARRVAEYNPNNDTRNPEELGTYYEGDILYRVDQPIGRNGIVATSSRWPNGIVPYRIALGFDPLAYMMITKAIATFNSKIPCVNFVPRLFQTDYIRIINDRGCYSAVGRIGGGQDVSVQSPGCIFKVGTILHELMHAIGFLHEQSRSDRDDFVDIKYGNIMRGAESNFKKTGPYETTSFGVPYTYSSVLHYSRDAFSINGKPTVVPKPDPNVVIGQRDGFDPNDVTKIRAMYGCPA